MSGFYGYLRLGEGRYRERFGLAFEDFQVGQVFLHRPGVTFTQQDNKDEALDGLNNAQLHYDEAYAAATEWQKPLGVSTLTLQLVLGMTSRSFYRRRRLTGLDEISMTRPVLGGDTLYARSEVLAVEPVALEEDDPEAGQADWGVVRLRTEAVNQRGETVARIGWPAEIWRAGRHPEELYAEGLEIAAEERFAAHHPGPDGALVEQTGLYFEDFKAGECFEHWPPRIVDGADSRRHALRALEINPLYSDPVFADDLTGAAPPVFEPFLIGAVTALTTRTFGRVVANLGWTEIHLPRSVRPGEQIWAASTVTGSRDSAKRPDQGILQVDTEAVGEDGSTICAFKRVLLVYKRGVGPYEAAGY